MAGSRISPQAPSSGERRFVLGAESAAAPAAGGVLAAVRCPISGRLLRDPVLAPDGHSYDRRALDGWQDTHGFDLSPTTGAAMPHSRYARNEALRGVVREWAEAHMGQVPRALAWEWQRGLECPVSGDALHDAVQLPDGRSYSRAAAQQLLPRFAASPITNRPWRDVEAVQPNLTLRRVVQVVHGGAAQADLRGEEVTANLPETLLALRDVAHEGLARLMAVEASAGGLGALRPGWMKCLKESLRAMAQYRAVHHDLPLAAQSDHERQQIERNVAKLEARVAMHNAISVTAAVAALPTACVLRSLGLAAPGLGLVAGSAVWLARTALVAPALAAVLAGALWDPEAVAPSRRLARRLGLEPHHVRAAIGMACGAGLAAMGVSCVGLVVGVVPTAWSATAVVAGALGSRLVPNAWPSCLAAVPPHRA